jgi:hypothetical protein
MLYAMFHLARKDEKIPKKSIIFYIFAA